MADTQLGKLYVTLEGRDVGLAQMLAQTRQQQQQTAQSAQSLGREYLALQRAQAGLEQQQARLARAQGDTERAAALEASAQQRLTTVLAAQDATTTATIGAQRQLISVQQQVERASQQTAQQIERGIRQGTAAAQSSIASLKQSTNAGQQFFDAFKGGLVGIVGPAAAATAAISAVTGVVRSFADAFEFKGNLDATTNSINLQLRGVRDMSTVWQEAAQFGRQYRVTQAETNEIIANSVDILRTSSSSVSELESALLRLQQRDASKPISEAARALRELNAGDVTSIKELFNVPAKEALRMKHEIEGGRDAVKVLNEFLERSGSSMEALASRTEGVKGKILELRQAEEELKLAQAAWAEGPGLEILQGKITVLSGLTRVLTGDAAAMGQSWRQNMDAYAQWIGLTDVAISSGGAWGNVIATNNTLLDAHERAAMAAATSQETLAQKTLDEALQAQINSVNTEALALKKNELAQQAQIAAQALLASGAAGAQTAANLANSSSLVDVLTAAYYRLAAAQAAATGAAIRSAAASSGIASRSAADETKLEGIQARRNANADKAAKNYNDMLDAQRDRINSIGTSQQRVAQAEADLAAARKQYGANSDEAYRAETKLLQVQEQSAKGGRAAHKAAGAGRLSDQQKFNNQSLSQQDKYQDDAEAKEREHYRKILDIQTDYEKKSAEQARRNEISKRTSRADFYEQLAEQDKINTQQFAAQYEEAYAKAQEIAQSGNRKLSEDYLAMRQRQIEKDQEFARKAAEIQADDSLSKKEKAAKLAQLEELRKLRQQANEEEIKQLLEGGDQINNELQQRLDDENNRYREATDEAAQRFDDLADRRIAAYDRAHQHITGTPPAEVTQARVANPNATTAAPASGAPPVSAGGTLADAIASQTGVLTGAIEGVRGAVEGLGPKLDAINRSVGNIKVSNSGSLQ